MKEKSEIFKKRHFDFNREGGARPAADGRLHVQDYFDYYRLDPSDYRPTNSCEAIRGLAAAMLRDFLAQLKPMAASLKEDDGARLERLKNR